MQCVVVECPTVHFTSLPSSPSILWIKTFPTVTITYNIMSVRLYNERLFFMSSHRDSVWATWRVSHGDWPQGDGAISDPSSANDPNLWQTVSTAESQSKTHGWMQILCCRSERWQALLCHCVPTHMESHTHSQHPHQDICLRKTCHTGVWFWWSTMLGPSGEHWGPPASDPLPKTQS